MTQHPYLQRLIELGIEPNFFISNPYLNQSSIHLCFKSGWIWVEEDEVPLFPALPILAGVKNGPYPIKEFWADFHQFQKQFQLPGKWEQVPLECEYLYRPKNFLNLAGGQWSTFRKNIRKWPGRNPGWTYTDTVIDYDQYQVFLGEWLEKHQDNVQDADFLIQCLLSPSEETHHRYLMDSEGTLKAINVWDENRVRLNYRFVLCAKEPFLDEFARFLFYTDPFILKTDKLVNDGGSLGFPGLEKFKDRLNPVQKRVVCSWRRID